MKLKNNFKDEDKIRVWSDHPYCAKCGFNEGCALHHIDGRKSSSIFNSIMLCHKCHKEADGHNVSDEEYKRSLNMISLPIILKTDYKMSKVDREYLESIKDRLEIIRSVV